LRSLPSPVPHIADEIDRWLPAHGIRTLADLTVQIPRRRPFTLNGVNACWVTVFGTRSYHVNWKPACPPSC
jgi:hypothetical protein